MTEINFVPKREVDKTKLLKVRHWVLAVTTVILVVYLVGIAGLFGMWFYQTSSTKKTSSEVDALLLQIRQYSEIETTARRLQARMEEVNKFLDGRGEASKSASILVDAQDVEVVDWQYAAGGGQVVKVKAEGPAQIFAFYVYSQEKYSQVQPDEVGWSVLDGWYGRFLLSQMNKEEG